MSSVKLHSIVSIIIIICLCLAVSSNDNNGLWECSVEEECSDLKGGECKKGYCVCPVDQTYNEDNTECVPADTNYLHVLSPCKQTSDCRWLITGFECKDIEDEKESICVCREGFHYLAGRCWASRGFSESCTVSSQCYDPLQPLSMECDGGTCTCKDSFYMREEGQCRRKATKLNDACVLDEDCSYVQDNPSAVCDLKSMTCVEPNIDKDVKKESQSIEFSENTLRAAVANTRASLAGEECYTNADCVSLGAAFCSKGRRCICNHGYYPTEDKTFCLAELGVKNPLKDTCEGFGAIIEDNMCICQAGFFYQFPFRNCRKPSRRFGESCTDDISCRTFGLFSYCSTDEETGLKNCDCIKDESSKNIERQFCEPFTTFIGQPCESNENCPPTAECVDKKCECVGNTIPNPSLVTCLKTGLGLGEECSITQQCNETKFAQCIRSKCACPAEYQQDDELGICIPGIGGLCESDVDCTSTIDNSKCVEYNGTDTEKRCACDSGYVDESNKCYKLTTDNLGKCEVNVQCSQLGNNEFVSCDKGRCTCLPGMHFRDGRCNEKKALREVCTSNSQCFIFGDVKNSECRNSLCQCLPGYRATFSPDTCSLAASLEKISWIVLLVATVLTIYNS